MYLSKKDFDFLIHLHDDAFTKKISVILDGETEKQFPLAAFLDVEDYVYYINMLKRLREERDKTNDRIRKYIAERRKVDKNYAREKSR